MNTAHVLVVEDDRSLRGFYEDLLRGVGYQVSAAANGGEALILLAVLPDLVLLDLRMPVVDGYAFLEELRSQFTGTPPKVLVVTAGADEAILARLGPVSVLRKPFDVDALLEAVRRAIEDAGVPAPST